MGIFGNRNKDTGAVVEYSEAKQKLFALLEKIPFPIMAMIKAKAPEDPRAYVKRIPDGIAEDILSNMRQFLNDIQGIIN